MEVLRRPLNSFLLIRRAKVQWISGRIPQHIAKGALTGTIDEVLGKDELRWGTLELAS